MATNKNAKQVRLVKNNGVVYPQTISEAVAYVSKDGRTVKNLTTAIDEKLNSAEAEITYVTSEDVISWTEDDKTDAAQKKYTEALNDLQGKTTANTSAITAETARAKAAEESNAETIQAVKEAADSAKSVTDAYFAEKKMFYDVIREEDIVLRTKDYHVNKDTLEWEKLSTPNTRDCVIINIRRAKSIVYSTISFANSLYLCSDFSDGKPAQITHGQIELFSSYFVKYLCNDYDYMIISNELQYAEYVGDSIYGAPVNWSAGIYPVIELTRAEYDSQAIKDQDSVTPYIMQYMISGEKVYPNYVLRANEPSDWSVRYGAVGTLVRHLSLVSNKAFSVSCNPRLETLYIEKLEQGIVSSNLNLKKVWIKDISVGDLGYFLIHCLNLKEIVFNNTDFSKVTSFTSKESPSQGMLLNTPNLTTITGKISNIKANICFDWSPLTRESALVVINGLADLTNSDTQTITFSGTTKALLTEEDKTLITSKNWTLA